MKWFNNHQLLELENLGFSVSDISYFNTRVMTKLEFYFRKPPTKKSIMEEFSDLNESLDMSLKSVKKLITSAPEDSSSSSYIYQQILLEDLKMQGDGNLLEKYLHLGSRLRLILQSRVQNKLPNEQTRHLSASPYLVEVVHDGLNHIGKNFPLSTSQSKDNKFYQVVCICWEAMGYGEPEKAVGAYIAQTKLHS